MKRKDRAVLPSLEGEMGISLLRRKNAQIYTAIGSYYLFEQKNDLQHLGRSFGGKGRLTVSFWERIQLRFDASYDRIFRWRTEGTIALNFPLGKSASDNGSSGIYPNMNHLMVQPVERRDIIPVEEKKKEFVATDERTGNSLHWIFVNNTIPFSGFGTFEVPFSSLALAQANSRPFDVIYVLAGDGTTTNMSSGILLQRDQWLQGSGLEFAICDVIVPALTPGINPTITNTAGSAVELSVSGNVVDAFNIASPTVNGVNSVIGGNYRISRNTITGASVGVNFVDQIGTNQVINNTITSTFVNIFLNVGAGRSVTDVSDNVVSGGAAGMAFIKSASLTGQYCLKLANNVNTAPGTYFIINSSGSASLFRIESPTASLAGLSIINVGTFGTFGPLLFVLPGTSCP